MKYPEEPHKPFKPIEPQEFYDERVYLNFDNYTGQLFLDVFESKLPEGITAKDIYCICEEEDSYDRCSVIQYLKLYYIKKMPTPNYKSSLKSYQRSMGKYEKEMSVYQKEMEEYTKKKEEYDLWFGEKELKRLKKEINRLKNKKAT